MPGLGLVAVAAVSARALHIGAHPARAAPSPVENAFVSRTRWSRLFACGRRAAAVADREVEDGVAYLRVASIEEEGRQCRPEVRRGCRPTLRLNSASQSSGMDVGIVVDRLPVGNMNTVVPLFLFYKAEDAPPKKGSNVVDSSRGDARVRCSVATNWSILGKVWRCSGNPRFSLLDIRQLGPTLVRSLVIWTGFGPKVSRLRRIWPNMACYGPTLAQGRPDAARISSEF